MELRTSRLSNYFYSIVVPLCLAIITGIVYYPSLSYEFQFDDIANITKHFHIRHYAFKDVLFSGSRWISSWLNSLHYKYSKFDPFSYRVGNVVIHIANGLFVFFILFTILRNLPQPSFFKRNAFPLSFLTALFFLLHPVQTQTVSYVIQGQLEGMAAFCTLLMVLCFLIISYTQQYVLKIILMILYFFIAVFSTGTKEIAIISPFLVMLVDWFFVARGNRHSLLSRWWFHLTTCGAIFGFYIYFLKPTFFIKLLGFDTAIGNNLGNVITNNPQDMITPFAYFISQFKVILHYIWIFLWPFNISVEYDWVLCKGILAPDCWIPFLILASIAYFTFRLLQQNSTHLISFCILWFVITIAPRSTIIPSPELIVDYKTYLASVGWFLLLAIACIKSMEWIVRKTKTDHSYHRYCMQYVTLAVLASGLGISTMLRNMVWSSSLDFWANIVKNAPGKARAYNNYGVELSQKLGRFAESIQFFEHAIKMDPNYRDPYNNLAVAYAATHQIDRAIATLQLSLKINPYYPEAYNNIASFLIEKGDYEEAQKALHVAIQLRPHYGKAYFNMARALMELNRPEEAWQYFKHACTQADLDNEAGFLGFAKASILLKKYDDAVFALSKALECNSTNADTLFNLANVYYLKNNFDQAITTYRELLRHNPQDHRVHYNLAESYFSSGDHKTALTLFEQLKKNAAISPNLYIRIAACHEKLGNPRAARTTLRELLQHNIPSDTRATIHAALEKLTLQYQLS